MDKGTSYVVLWYCLLLLHDITNSSHGIAKWLISLCKRKDMNGCVTTTNVPFCFASGVLMVPLNSLVKGSGSMQKEMQCFVWSAENAASGWV